MDNDDRIFRYLVYRRCLHLMNKRRNLLMRANFKTITIILGLSKKRLTLAVENGWLGFRPINDCSGVVCDRLEYFNLKKYGLSILKKINQCA